jgi:ATP-dependent DNA helicase RecQ
MDWPALARRCGVDELRPFQCAAIAALDAGRDVLVSVSTGGGKTMVYQAAAVHFGGPLLVVTPLLSLMQDQMRACTERHLRAVRLGDPVGEGPCVVLTTPEAIAAGRLASMPTPRAIVVDEAHLVPAWGFSFRDSYTQLGALRDRWGGVPILALTATVSLARQRDVERLLKMHSPVVVAGPAVRPNLVFALETARSAGDARTAAAAIAGAGGRCIVYCRTKKACDQLAAELVQQGREALAYHSDLPADVRAATLERFVASEVIVTATVAFGLGVNVAAVRAVVNLGCPDTPDALWQQAGRAGRDGLVARCVVVTWPGDMHGGRDGMAAGGMSTEDAQQEAFRGLQTMREYLALRHGCRQLFLTQTFVQDPTRAACGACDLCTRTPGDTWVAQPTQHDVARVALLLSRTGSIGRGTLLDLLCGEGTQRTKPLMRHRGHDWPRDRAQWDAAIKVAMQDLIQLKSVVVRNGFRVAVCCLRD